MSKSDLEGIVLRPAVRADGPAIRAMVRTARLNPLGIDWRNFLVAEEGARRIVAIGAVKTHGDGSRELASIAVAPAWRGRGIADAVIRTILARESAASGALYLTCRDEMEDFYKRFGFRRIGVEEMPPYFRRLYRLAAVVTGVLRKKNRLTVMACSG
jgi:N-acetylglutamate synthase-like GNAT family acetyltransferase